MPLKSVSHVVLLSCLILGIADGSIFSRDAIQYGEPKEICRIKDDRISESSGLAASLLYRDAFWTHNDSGDSARIFLFNKSGDTLAVVNLKGTRAVDWEDMASFKHGKESYILIADTGDNLKRRENCLLYLVREPADIDTKAEEALTLEVEPALTISFSYEDGPHDCEAVGVDPAGSTIYFVSKELGQGKIYSMPIPPEGSKEPNIARAIATDKIVFVSAMDISPDGMRTVLLTYRDAYEFARADGETWAQAFSRESRFIKMPVRRQGESICYGADGKTLYLSSEGKSQPFWEVPVVAAR